MLDKLEKFTVRIGQIDELLASPEVASDIQRMNKLAKERAGLQPVVDAYQQRLAENEPREAAEFLRLIALTDAPGAEGLLREALGHSAAVLRTIAASGLERLTGERVEILTKKTSSDK